MTPQLVGTTADRFFHDALAPVRASRLLADWIAEDLADERIQVPPPVAEHLSDLKDQADFLDTILRRTSLWLSLSFEGPARSSILDAAKSAQKTVPGLQLTTAGAADWPLPQPRATLLLKELFENAMIHGSGLCQLDITSDDGRLVVQIDSPGRTLRPNVLDQVMHPFQSHGTSRHTGLGLPIVARIAELYGAQVSTNGQTGLTLRLTFPKETG